MVTSVASFSPRDPNDYNDDDNDYLLTIIADDYILMVFGLWLGYSSLGMKTVTVDKYIWEHTHAISPSRSIDVLKSYTSLSPSGILSLLRPVLV